MPSRIWIKLLQTLIAEGYPRIAYILMDHIQPINSDDREFILFSGVMLANRGYFRDAIQRWEKGRTRYPQDDRFVKKIQKARDHLEKE